MSWTIDCEASQAAYNDTAAGERAVHGFVEILQAAELTGTLFVLPADAEAYPRLLQQLAKQGFQVGLHYHPHEDGYDDHCGAFSAQQQRVMFGAAIARFEDVVGFTPRTFRTGCCSANDATFPVTADLGFTSCSLSMPGRRMTNLRANWSEAPMHVHYAHPTNRLLEGKLNLVEVPVTTDPDSMLWSGKHPQDLRVELFDAKNHRFMIDKVLAREKNRQHPVRSIVTITHNTFDFDRPDDFRTQTLRQMICDFRELADRHHVTLVPATIGSIADAYRSAVPQVAARHEKPTLVHEGAEHVVSAHHFAAGTRPSKSLN